MEAFVATLSLRSGAIARELGTRDQTALKVGTAGRKKSNNNEKKKEKLNTRREKLNFFIETLVFVIFLDFAKSPFKSTSNALWLKL